MDDIARYLTIRSTYGAAFRDDGKQLACLHDATGHPEVWTVDTPRGWPTQRTVGEDAVRFCTYVPEGAELVFGRDRGGNERTQFYRLDPADGDVTPLTDRPEAKHYWGGWAHDDETFAFSSNRRDEAVFDLYVQSIEERGEAASRVYESDTWLVPMGFDPDDRRLLVKELRASFDNALHVCDLEEGSLERLTDPDVEARYISAQWGPGGDGVYCVTDVGADTQYLARIDPTDGAIETVYRGGDWNVDGLAIDEDSGRLLYARNVDGYAEIHVGALAGPTTIDPFPEPGLPDGVAGGVSFEDGGVRLALTHTSRSRNTSIFVVDVTSGTVERWTSPSTAGIPRETFRSPELVRITSVDDLEIPGFLTMPERTGNRPVPAIVDVHGGPESQRRPTFSGLTQYFLANGFAVFEPNVRGSSGYGKAYAALDDVENRMDSVADLAACADWLADRSGIDEEALVLKGGSYGGFMVLAAMTEYPDRWAAGIDIVGIANFVTFLENTGAWRREHRESEYGSLEDDREFLERISPINRIDRIAAPLFVIHGRNDPRVPVGEAEQVAEAAAEHVPVETLIFEDEGHGITKLDNQIEAYRRAVSFLDEHLP